jgi:hypothetical protein
MEFCLFVCFCFGTPLWFIGQKSQVRFPALPDFVSVGLEYFPFSLVRIIEELLE